MIKRGVLGALLLAAAAQGFVFPLGRGATTKAAAAVARPGHCSSGGSSTGFGEQRVAAGVQPLRMSASTAEPPAAKETETFEFQAEVSRYVWSVGVLVVGASPPACPPPSI